MRIEMLAHRSGSSSLWLIPMEVSYMLLPHEPEVDRLLEWDIGRTPGPYRISLLPTNRCNLHCAMCWRQAVESVDDSEISDERLLRVVEEAADLDVQEWLITGGGEPLMRAPLVMELCKRIKRHGMTGRLNTNGILLNRERAETLIEIGWDTIYFSLDGPDAASNDVVRSPGAFERTTQSIIRMRDLKRAHGVERPASIFNGVLTTFNCDKVDRMIEMALELGLTGGVNLQSLVVFGESNAALEVTPDQQKNLRDHLERAAVRAGELGLDNNFMDLLATLDTPMASPREERRVDLIDATCFEAWLHMVILPCGHVGPCCVFRDDTADTIHDRSLKEVWLGPYLSAMRKKLIANMSLPYYCKHCKTSDQCRAQRFRRQMYDLQWSRWGDMTLRRRGRLVSKRLRGNLRAHGIGGTLRRVWEWTQLHMR